MPRVTESDKSTRKARARTNPSPEQACTQCTKTFPNASALSRHAKSHLSASEKEFVCPHCDHGFNQRCHLKAHIASKHEKNRPYVCKFEGCGACYNDPACRTKHYINKHGQPTAPRKLEAGRRRHVAAEVSSATVEVKQEAEAAPTLPLPGIEVNPPFAPINSMSQSLWDSLMEDSQMGAGLAEFYDPTATFNDFNFSLDDAMRSSYVTPIRHAPYTLPTFAAAPAALTVPVASSTSVASPDQFAVPQFAQAQPQFEPWMYGFANGIANTNMIIPGDKRLYTQTQVPTIPELPAFAAAASCLPPFQQFALSEATNACFPGSLSAAPFIPSDVNHLNGQVFNQVPDHGNFSGNLQGNVDFQNNIPGPAFPQTHTWHAPTPERPFDLRYPTPERSFDLRYPTPEWSFDLRFPAPEDCTSHTNGAITYVSNNHNDTFVNGFSNNFVPPVPQFVPLGF